MWRDDSRAGSSVSRFVIEVWDTSLASIVDDRVIQVDGIQEVLSLIGLDDVPEHPGWIECVTPDEFHRLTATFGMTLRYVDGNEITVRSWHWRDGLPYKSHTGRELPLMLQRRKPLAVFRTVICEGCDQGDFGEAQFDARVAEGLFVKRECVRAGMGNLKPGMSERMVLYARKGKEWRIDAYLLLCDMALGVQWNDGFERVEGALLGYHDWESDAYFAALESVPGRKIWDRRRA